jgi:hypothetical protein
VIDATRKAVEDAKMPRFVLLLHLCPGDRPRPTHFDLMLEADGVLWTWALTLLPLDWRKLADDQLLVGESNRVSAERLADHRLDYLMYEGPVSGDRGEVRRLEAGMYRRGTAATQFVVEGNVIRGELEFVANAGSSVDSQLIYWPAPSTADSVRPAT